MNTRKLVRLFFTTLFIGAVTSLVTSFFLRYDVYLENLKPFNILGLIGLFYWHILYGFIFSIVSQAGFFAFLFINRIGLGIFRGIWSKVQYVLVAFVIFDLIYFPYQATKGDVALIWYILMAGSLLAYGLFIANIKAKETNRQAFAPALFLMVVMTTVEWVPSLQVEGTQYAWLMIFSLLACNTYQLLILHRLTGGSKEEMAEA